MRTMNISFDLDSTLIPHGGEFEAEKRSLIAKFLGIETIRKGTCKLFQELQQSGHNISIYTTSFRSAGKIRRMFWFYGLKVDKVINQTKNQKALKTRNINSSKYPPTFDFDLHIDESKGVEIEASRFNFNVIIVDPNDKHWEERIKSRITCLL